MLLSARETADRLGVKLDTLYAYVSRGLLRSVEISGSRERHYDIGDVERFRTARGGPRQMRAQAEALMPVIGSAICLIENHRLYYRGQDALHLADTATLEDAAALLWSDGEADFAAGEGARPPGLPSAAKTAGLIERCQMRLAALSATDLAALDLSRAGVIRTGRLIVAELASCVGAAVPSPAPAHHRLAESWNLNAAGTDLIRRCLVLLADHELNASTFVARCVASTGATPYAAVSAALAALSGRFHGGASARAEALFHGLTGNGGVAGDTDAMTVMAARLARDEALPGMGQPLYPDGDPRATAILAAARVAVPAQAAWIDRITAAAMRLTGQHPNVDFGLAAAATALGLPQGAALGLFVVARSVGWIAHAIEQYDSHVLIRPRARYIGRRP
ncbi:MAG TPA: citrate/2-methylcitrate synthase [Stellaceae bacterium]|jgi:citrate synthase|nr:citrate/2-methylcitrate synthase [Stellaceae bacterium]